MTLTSDSTGRRVLWHSLKNGDQIVVEVEVAQDRWEGNHIRSARRGNASLQLLRRWATAGVPEARAALLEHEDHAPHDCEVA